MKIVKFCLMTGLAFGLPFAAAAQQNVAEHIAFGIIAVGMIIGAIRVVTTQNIVHAALWLVTVLGGAAVAFSTSSAWLSSRRAASDAARAPSACLRAVMSMTVPTKRTACPSSNVARPAGALISPSH